MMRYIPSEVLLSWPTPNYTDPVTRGNTLVIVNSIFLALVIIVVALRLYTRLVVKRWFGSDDAFIALALISTIGLTAIVLLANQEYGWDRHVWDIPFNKIAGTSQIALAAKCVYTAAATFTRLSLFCFYYRLVHDSSKRTFRWAIHTNLAFSVAIFITFNFLSIFQCNPMRNYWTFQAPPNTCLNEGTVTFTSGVINCVADFFCTLLPIPMVVRLAMPKRQRIAVVFLFSLGFIVTISGAVRTYYIYKSLVESYDQTWEAYPLWIAAAIEIDLGVICASAPVLRPLLMKVPFLVTLPSRSSKKANSSGCMTKGSSNLDSNTPNQSNFTLQGIRNSQYRSGLSDTKHREEPIEEESRPEVREEQEQHRLTDWADVERGTITTTADGTRSMRDSEDVILSSEEEEDKYMFNPQEHPERHRGVSAQPNPRISFRISAPDGGRLSRVGTRSFDAVGVAQ